jgi:2-keto-4-pentenoate hydratase/2-oxohepta-3-ene-1,7-dioic acid hydratase in catechol pathway
MQDDGAIEVIRGSLLDPVERAGERLREADIVRYLAPVDPPNLLCIGLNYVDHAKETGAQIPEAPLLFIAATTAVTAHLSDVVLPRVAPDHVDYEAELCVILSRHARNVTAEEALDYVFGYTCGNDITARDCQTRDGQWARSKSFDTFAPLGPCAVTGIDPGDLAIRMRLNGRVMQDSSTAKMAFNVPALVSYLSQWMTLRPGTVIMTGTPGGIGQTRKPPVFLRPGDVCEVEIEGIGILRNTVGAE